MGLSLLYSMGRELFVSQRRHRIDFRCAPRGQITCDGRDHGQKCNLIYVEASDVFRQLESRDDWLTICEHTRASLGYWVTFNLRTLDNGPSFLAHVDGTAVFSSGSYRLSTAWNLENGRAKLFGFCLEGNVVVPRSHLPLPKLIDPPPSRFGPVNT
jgi:hypothetical protein